MMKFQRAELQKFLKLVRRKKPSVKYSLHFDKLFLDNEIYIYNEVTGQVTIYFDNQYFEK